MIEIPLMAFVLDFDVFLGSVTFFLQGQDDSHVFIADILFHIPLLKPMLELFLPIMSIRD